MATHMGIMALLGTAASISLLSGWRLYLCILATGIAMRWHIFPLPEHLKSLAVLANIWVLGAAALAAICEFFADKVLWLDSLWDMVHTAIRPVGGALLTMAIIDPSDPAMQVVAFILGGSGALLAHSGKAGARAVINVSPEPFTNIVASSAEDAATSGLLYVVYAHPFAAAGVASFLMSIALGLIVVSWRIFGRFFGRKPSNSNRPEPI